jgi:peptidoglycan/LPS O-acetylase OafA/YrhL
MLDMAEQRRPELDGLRGVAVLLIVYHHWTPLTFDIHPDSVIGRLTALSWSGVDLFFVLSGFLIGGILLDNRKSASYFKTFYVRRACRILPLYLLSLSLFYLTRSNGWLWDSALPWYAYFTFTQNIWTVFTPQAAALWLVPTWSLAVEEQFYLTLPLLLRRIDVRNLPRIVLITVITVTVFRTFLYFNFRFAAAANYVLLPSRADALMLGVWAAWCERNGKRISKRLLYPASALLFSGFIALSWFAPDRTAPLMMTAGYGLIAFFYLSVLLLATQGGFQFLRMPVLTSVGVLAYWIYLFHLPTVGLLRGHEPSATLDPIATLIALPVVFLCAKLSWKYFEKPLVDLGHRWRYGHSIQR